MRHRRFDGQMHGFFTMADVPPAADEAMDYVVAGVDEQLAGELAGASRAPGVGRDHAPFGGCPS